MIIKSHLHEGVKHLFQAAISVRVISMEEIDAALIDRWTKLVETSANPNPFISPQFVLPAAKSLGAKEPLLIIVENGKDLIGLGIFETRAASQRMPLPHLRAWQTPHSFQAGMLFDRDHVHVATSAFWDFLTNGTHRWNAVEFPLLQSCDASNKVLVKSANDSGIECWTGHELQRAALHLDAGLNQRTLTNISTRRARSLRRGWNSLTKQGEVTFQIRHQPHEIEEATQTLLSLESMGWKGKQKTALASNPQRAQFFHDMVQQFALNHSVFFTELSIDDEPIASVVHLIAAKRAAAFKLGWNPAYERGCPGYQIKALLIKHMQTFKAISDTKDVQAIDSCASPGSFIEHVWPDRETFATHLFMTSRAGMVAGSIIGGLRWMRNTTKRFLDLSVMG